MELLFNLFTRPFGRKPSSALPADPADGAEDAPVSVSLLKKLRFAQNSV
ncbi:MAG TPA: hypothetical protein VKU00_24045 [Chthonomonadaceae bacterium]|nr:hypothetical protein [Chthonomonadaceae bacterium]